MKEFSPKARTLLLPRVVCLALRLVVVAAFMATGNIGSAAAQGPSPTFTVSGTVTDTSGQPIPNVTMILLSDVTGTTIAFTDQSGNYALPYVGGVNHSLRITPSKLGYLFDPLTVIFIGSRSFSENMTQPFVGTALPFQIPLPIDTPFLLTQENSQRALALESVNLTSEPFGVINTNNLSSDQRTRLSLFAVNVELTQGEPLTVIEAQAEDSLGQVFPLTVESYRAVPNQTWLKQIVVKLPDAIADKVEVRMSLKLRGVAGNKVIVKVKP